VLPNLKLMNIIISPDHVIIVEQKVVRPPEISPSQWLDFWERVVDQRRRLPWEQ
jgi:hypothetical protein